MRISERARVRALRFLSLIEGLARMRWVNLAIVGVLAAAPSSSRPEPADVEVSFLASSVSAPLAIGCRGLVIGATIGGSLYALFGGRSGSLRTRALPEAAKIAI